EEQGRRLTLGLSQRKECWGGPGGKCCWRCSRRCGARAAPGVRRPRVPRRGRGGPLSAVQPQLLVVSGEFQRPAGHRGRPDRPEAGGQHSPAGRRHFMFGERLPPSWPWKAYRTKWQRRAAEEADDLLTVAVGHFLWLAGEGGTKLLVRFRTAGAVQHPLQG